MDETTEIVVQAVVIILGALGSLFVTGITAVKVWLKKIDKEVNHKNKHGRKETLYELAHKNDIVAEQTFMIVKEMSSDFSTAKRAVSKLAASHAEDKAALKKFKTEVRTRLKRIEDSAEIKGEQT